MQIVAFGGLAGAGKTTAQNILATWAFEAGYNVVLDRFAGPLKRASELLGFQKGGQYDAHYRKFCQWAGAEARSIAEDWWVQQMRQRLDVYSLKEQEQLTSDAPFHETLVIIDDVRYPNEVALAHQYTGIAVFIDSFRRLRDLDAEWRKHESEQMATDYTLGRLPDNLFDYRLVNCSTPDALTTLITQMGPSWVQMDAKERTY